MLPKSDKMIKISPVILFLVISTAYSRQCPQADTKSDADFMTNAKTVLEGNWVPSMNSTLPSPALYPHQWSWDSAFIAIGYSHYDTQRAIDEMEALFRGQWRSGIVPHIVFNPLAVESYFPGPSFWNIDRAGERGPENAWTSGITQPPVHAVASLAIYENAGPDWKEAALEHLKEMYPKLIKWHDYLYRERDPLKHGLVFIRHMWESGMDNSPAWDDALARMVLKEGDVPAYQRVDKGKVGHSNERPTEFFYDRAVHLIKVFYDNDYDEERIFEKCPFLIEDVLFNSILAHAGEALGRIAEILGSVNEARSHRSRSEWTASAITERLYNEEDEYFYDFDLVSGKQIPAKISGGLVAVYGAKMEAKHMRAIVKALFEPGFLGSDLSAWTIPSVSRDHPGYSDTMYWKGPAWINVNYLVQDGLARNGKGNTDALRIARFLRDRSLKLMKKSGFYEYFNTLSGAPLGGYDFSWSAALAIDWMCSCTDSQPEREFRMVWVLVAAVIMIAVRLAVVARFRLTRLLDPNVAIARESDQEATEGSGKNQPLIFDHTFHRIHLRSRHAIRQNHTRTERSVDHRRM